MKTYTCPLEERYERALDEAEQKLASLNVACGRPVNLKGLRGWVFEQTVRTCLQEELKERGVILAIDEQVSIGDRVKIDLLIGTVAVEVKAAGFFGNEGARYSDYRKKVEAKGWHYLYLTLHETYRPYVEVARTSFGDDKAFFLDQKGSWIRFVSTVVRLSKK
jgi:hypothetical protein